MVIKFTYLFVNKNWDRNDKLQEDQQNKNEEKIVLNSFIVFSFVVVGSCNVRITKVKVVVQALSVFL